MKCDEINDRLSLYIDNELSPEEMRQVEEHLQSCEICQKEYEDYKNLISVLNGLPEEEPPEGYCKRLHKKLLENRPQGKAKKQTSKIMSLNRSKWLKYGSIAAALVLVIAVAGINNFGGMGMKAKNESSYDMSTTEAPAAPQAMPMEPQNGAVAEESMGGYEKDYDYTRDEASHKADDSIMTTSVIDQKEMKIIKTGTISAETEDYDTFLNDLSIKISSVGGFLESNNTEVYQVFNDEKLMYGSIRIRVPQENFYELVDYLENAIEVKRKNINETDVTKDYYEKDNRVKNLEVQEQHLRDLFEKATTVEEMLLIENELRRVRTEIDALNISLSDIDDRAAMSTINLEIQEVMTASLTLKTKDSVWERSRDGFINSVNGIIRSLENLLVGIVSSLPILIPAIIICIVGFLKLRKHWKREI
ncbi:MAG TPA: DUF4349 domain-containing protein [Sedimentibacter sp.]|nr:DUF4349 domain-containing protein [Sedimentibacter sp.]HNZ83294.1 DUF4349 domain-containing protein [Sedimentibacter sp.]HOH69177.1 DUF4349 domain-containing protein [Sedimentibacter sp.]HPW99621.1 DUF4349 domain-containing protein [Sedimentibacter sp.]